jgi:hypothetical protein
MATTLSWALASLTISMNGTYGRYTKNTPRVELAMTPSIMYSPLMPLPRCLLHLIYLPTYVFFPLCQHLFEVTDLTTRGCSFFGDSNCPTLFICYQGSIEKLTLLGAIYYYYYYFTRDPEGPVI